MGVVSFKIEGRMKRPEYVAAATAVCRQMIDSGRVDPAVSKALSDVFSRSGFTDGYYTGKLGKDMFGIRDERNDQGDWLKEARQTYEATEVSLVPLRFYACVTPHESYLTVSDAEGRSCTVVGPIPERARTQDLTREMLQQRLEKTGGTPYLCAEFLADVTPGLMLSAASINAMRRDALNQMTALRARRDPVRLGRVRKIQRYPGNTHQPELTVQVTNRDQITGRLLKLNPKVLYVPLHILTEDSGWTRELCKKANVCVVLPRILHDGEIPTVKNALVNLRALGVGDALVGNLGHLLPVRECGLNVRGDFGLNLYNSVAVNTMRDLELRSATLSFEMTLPQIRDVSKAVPTEILVYGRLPLMVTENCIIQGKTGSCTCHLSGTKLSDKTGAEFPVIKDGNSCRSVLLNGKKLNLLDRQEDLAHLGLWATRLYFTTENPREVDLVLNSYLKPTAFDPGASTRGLYLRGID